MFQLLFATSPFWLPILTVPQAYDVHLLIGIGRQSREPKSVGADFYFKDIDMAGAAGYVLAGLFVFSIVYAVQNRYHKGAQSIHAYAINRNSIVIFRFLTVKGMHSLSPIIPPLVLLGVSFLFSDSIKKFLIINPCNDELFRSFLYCGSDATLHTSDTADSSK